MPLESMTRMLRQARTEQYAIGAFNILDYNSMKAVVDAAEQTASPVIIQTSAKTVVFWGHDAIMSWVRELTAHASVPVAVHLDHCKDLDLIEQCIRAGWTSVMIDASALPFEENIAMTQKVIDMAHAEGVSVEAELGRIVGVEDDLTVEGEDAHLADPDEAVDFCERLRLDCFAPAIGTAHGLYKGEPKISFERLSEISRRTSTPLALHGGTGLSDDVFRRCILLGCAKVNISTQLKHTFIDAFVGHHQAHADQYDPLKVLGAQHSQLVGDITANLKRFDSVGKTSRGA